MAVELHYNSVGAEMQVSVAVQLHLASLGGEKIHCFLPVGLGDVPVDVTADAFLRVGVHPGYGLALEHYGSDSFQGCSVVNYTVSEDYTRIPEFKYLTGQKDTDGTTVSKEYPLEYSGSEGEIPYYAVVNGGSQALYGKYRALAGEYATLYLLGRLAEFKYYNMDQAALRAMELAGSIIDKSEKK